jgi:hypothetical protein
LYTSSTTYKITLNYAVGAGTQNQTSTAWILKNGTVLAVNFAGQNVTGASAQTMVAGLFAGFSEEVFASSQLSTYTASQYFHSTGTSSVTIGSNSLTVTNYAANKLPQTITLCSGDVSTLTGFKLSVGTPRGTTFQLVTDFEIAGSSSSNGQSSQFNLVVKVVSFALG